MKKDFIEYDGDIKMAPNDVKDILEYLTNVLDNYEIKLKNELLDEFEVQRESNLLKDVLCNALVMINGRDKVNRVNNCNGEINIELLINGETMWVTQKTMGEIFDKDRTVITKH